VSWRPGNWRHPGRAGDRWRGSGQAAVYGDAAYGSGELVERVEDAGIYSGIKVQPPPAVKGHFPKDRFAIDPDGQAVTCPAGITAPIRASGRDRHTGEARFCAACRTCPLAAQCTTAKGGRTITIGPHEARLAAARQAQASPAWKADYKATRPKVERKIGHLMRRRRAPRPGPRAAQGRRRLRPARRRSQPGPPRRARHCLPQRRLGGRRRLITGNGRPTGFTCPLTSHKRLAWATRAAPDRMDGRSSAVRGGPGMPRHPASQAGNTKGRLTPAT